MSEARLIRRAQRGDRKALDSLLRQELAAARQTIHRILGSDSDVDDVLQQTLVEVVRSLESFRGGSRLRTWVTRIAIRATWAHLRRRRKVIPLNAAVERLHAEQRGRPSAESSAELKRLQRCLAEIPSVQRIVFVMRDVEGYTTREIAALLDVPAGTVSTRLRSARERVRRALTAKPLVRRLDSSSGGGRS